MRYGILFFGIMLFGIGFEFAQQYDESFGRTDLFLRSSREIYPSSYVYYSGEHLTYIGLALIIRRLMSMIPYISEHKHYALLFVILESVDFIDFWVTNNDLWFEYHGWPVTYNVIKIFVFTLVLITYAANRLIPIRN